LSRKTLASANCGEIAFTMGIITASENNPYPAEHSAIFVIQFLN